MLWHLHYDQKWNNRQIAEKFRRTTCGIMVQLDQMYADKREHEDIECRKYLYTHNVQLMKRGKLKWSAGERRWVKTAEWEGKQGSDWDTEESSSEDDDEPIGWRQDRMLREQHKTEKSEKERAPRMSCSER